MRGNRKFGEKRNFEAFVVRGVQEGFKANGIRAQSVVSGASQGAPGAHCPSCL